MLLRVKDARGLSMLLESTQKNHQLDKGFQGNSESKRVKEVYGALKTHTPFSSEIAIESAGDEELEKLKIEFFQYFEKSHGRFKWDEDSSKFVPIGSE